MALTTAGNLSIAHGTSRNFAPLGRDGRSQISKAAAVVRQGEVDRGPIGTMPVGFTLAVAAVIVPLDVIDVHGLGDARHLIEIAQIIREIRIVDDAAQSCI